MSNINKERLNLLSLEAMAGTKKFIRLKDGRVKRFFWEAAKSSGNVVAIIRYAFKGTDTIFRVGEHGSGVGQHNASMLIIMAKKIATEIKNGGDPQARHSEKKKTRALERALGLEAKAEGEVLLTEVMDDYYSKLNIKPRSKKLTRRSLNELDQALGHLRPQDVTRKAIRELLDVLEHRGKEGNFSVAQHCLKTGRAFWNWAAENEVCGFDVNHFALLKPYRLKYTKASQKESNNLIQDKDIRELAGTYFVKFSKNMQRAVVLQSLTAVRGGCVTSSDPLVVGGPRFPIDWNEFDIHAGTWTIPANRMKGRMRTHLIDMPRQLLAWVKIWYEEDGRPDSGLVVRPLRSASKMATPNTLGQEYRRAGLSYTSHKWRHAVATFVAEKHSNELAELVLGHYTANNYVAKGTTRRKDRAAALQEWADKLDILGFDKLVPSLIQ